MKKGILILIEWLVAFCFLAGCGTDQYVIERQYWKTQKQAEKIFKNPHASPPKQLEKAVKLLNTFAANYPNNRLSLEAEFNIARLYIVKEENDNARKQLEALLVKYSKHKDICAEALFLIGNSYQIENNWNLALQQYKKIMQEYPLTVRGLDVPIYIAQHYKVKYQPDKMISAFQEAIRHYQALATQYPNSVLSYNVEILVAKCYVSLKDWQNALATYNAIMENYKGKINMDGVLMEMALIYGRELKDKPKAKELLKRLINDYPRSRLIKATKALLDESDKKGTD